MELFNLYRITWGNDSTEYSANTWNETMRWFRDEFSKENGIEGKPQALVECIGFTVSDGDDTYDCRSEYQLNETVCEITWCLEDVICAMVKNGVPITDANIDKLLSNRFERTLQERSTEDGWETIDAIIGMTEFE